MNLFVTHENPGKAAAGLDDKRVVKLALECAQMLSAAIHRHAPDRAKLHVGAGALMLSTHYNHPVTRWVGESVDNWFWCWKHGVALCVEYNATYGRTHACAHNLKYMAEHRLWKLLPEGALIPFQNSARNGDVDFSWIEPTTEAYRQYLMARWRTDKRPVTFRNRVPPAWVDRSLIQETV